jgi:hypothetical protein
VRREFIIADSLGKFFNDMPNQLLRHSLTQGLPALLTFRKSFPVLMPAASMGTLSFRVGFLFHDRGL